MSTRPLRATYRLQLTQAMDFEHARALVDYLGALGVSHLYASPCLQAEPGSTHGYDVVDPGLVSAELGGSEGWHRLVNALHDAELGLILDVVPNHMSIAGTTNPWWGDVLENGPSSPYASYFDVDWGSTPEENRILMPFLGDRYGAELAAGRLSVVREGGAFRVRYYERTLAVAPRSIGGLLLPAAHAVHSDELAFLAEAFEALPLPSATDLDSTRRRHRDKAVLGQLLTRLFEREPAVAAAVDDGLVKLNGDPERLDELLTRQNWRLAHWRTAASELGYRRFFDVSSLVGLCIEKEHVFQDTHRLVIRELRQRRLDGVRIDHPDGLRDPGAYFERLRTAAPEAWILAEKILHPGEQMPRDWPVDGTTGYDFAELIGRALVDPAGEVPLTALAARYAEDDRPLDALVIEAKVSVLHEVLGSELSRLVALLVRVANAHPETRDYTQRELTDGLASVLIGYSVYRTYLRVGTAVRPEDRRCVDAAIERAATTEHADRGLLEFLRRLLLLEIPGEDAAEFALRVQQVTGALTAKSVEDTVFYRHIRLLASNEVGGSLAQFSATLEELHLGLGAPGRARTMLSTSTHDTKRSEDVRARLAALSEIPDAWVQAVDGWSRRAERHRAGEFPDRHAELFFWQTLVGAWPLPANRALPYMEKAIREAKRRTSWSHPEPVYEDAVRNFVLGVLGDAELLADVEALVARILPAGRHNALLQTLVKLTAPGVPDIYQGCELWDLSLVDPDNRRPVDFEVRRQRLAELDALSPTDVVARMDEGLPKLWLIRQALRLRARVPEAFGEHYAPCLAQGPLRDRVIAYARGPDVVIVAPRWTLGARSQDLADTTLTLGAGRWENVLDGGHVEGGDRSLAEIVANFPVALLWRTP